MPLSPLPGIRGVVCSVSNLPSPQVHPTPVDNEGTTSPLDFGSGALPKILESEDGERGEFTPEPWKSDRGARILLEPPVPNGLGWGGMAVETAIPADDTPSKRRMSFLNMGPFSSPLAKGRIVPMKISTRRNSKAVTDLEYGQPQPLSTVEPFPPTSATTSPPEKKTGRRASMAVLLEGGVMVASNIASGAGSVRSAIKKAGRRASVAMGLSSAPNVPKKTRKVRRAVGNEVQAFLSMVPGGDGESISRDQYTALLKTDLKRLKLGSIDPKVVDKMVTSVFRNDIDRLDLASFEQLLQDLKMPIGRLTNGDKAMNGQVRREDTIDQQKRSLIKRIQGKFKKIFDDNGYKMWVAIYIATNVILASYVYFSRKGWLDGSSPQIVGACNGEIVNMARASGMLLNFNSALVIVPMYRAILTWLQGTWLTNYVPFDKAYDAHQVIGTVTFVMSLAHGLFHVINLVLWDGWSLNSSLWCGTEEDGGFLYCSAVSGILIQIVFCVMIAFSIPYFRNSSRFNYFWAMHHLALVFYVVLLLHGRVFWKWFLPVVLTYGFDRWLRRRTASFPSTVLLTKAKGDKVMQIQFSKPASLNYVPGQYVFLKSGAITKYEWHPFTLTSSPEDAYLECHIKAVGDWTSALHEQYAPDEIVDGKHVFSLPSHQLQVDGPHGAPAQDWSQYQSAVLISAGIGVTPFASIIKHIHIRMQQSRALEQAGLRVPSSLALNLKKVYFFWICRTQESFKWFTEIIAQTKEQMGDRFEIHVYLSTVSALGDVTAGMTHMGLHAYFQQHHQDAITGLDTLTNYDRPQWRAVFAKLASQHEDEKVGVFYCGPRSLGKTLEKQCTAATAASSTTFSFAKENF